MSDALVLAELVRIADVLDIINGTLIVLVLIQAARLVFK